MRFLVITSAPTLNVEEQLRAYSPYVKEMDIWFRNAIEIGIASPGRYPGKVFTKEFSRQDIRLFKLPFVTWQGLAEFFLSLIKIPFTIAVLFRSFLWTDHIHLRCPGNIGLMACIFQIFFPGKPKSAKYAGNWDPDSQQPWSYNFQKWILSNTFLTRNIKVLVYGEWPGQTSNIKSFFTASFSEREIDRVREKNFDRPFTFIFVGNLVEGKRPLEAIRLVEKLNVRKKVSLEIFGDGPERNTLERYVKKKRLEQLINFQGSRPLEELKRAYQHAHFVILPSRSEGWPKAIAEGMFYGCIPIATPVSCVPWMLGYGSRGILLKVCQESGNQNQNRKHEWSMVSGQGSVNIEAINDLLSEPKRMEKMSEAAKEWSQQYTLEKFEEAIKKVLYKRSKKSSSPFGRGRGEG